MEWLETPLYYKNSRCDNPICSTRDEISQPSRPISPRAANIDDFGGIVDFGGTIVDFVDFGGTIVDFGGKLWQWKRFLNWICTLWYDFVAK